MIVTVTLDVGSAVSATEKESVVPPSVTAVEPFVCVTATWGESENNRRARYYRLTAAGRKQLAHETGRWDRLVQAVNRVLRPVEE